MVTGISCSALIYINGYMYRLKKKKRARKKKSELFWHINGNVSLRNSSTFPNSENVNKPCYELEDKCVAPPPSRKVEGGH